jgi:hypothetical protein
MRARGSHRSGGSGSSAVSICWPTSIRRPAAHSTTTDRTRPGDKVRSESSPERADRIRLAAIKAAVITSLGVAAGTGLAVCAIGSGREMSKPCCRHKCGEHGSIEGQWLERARAPGRVTQVSSRVDGEGSYSSPHNRNDASDFQHPFDDIQTKGLLSSIAPCADHPNAPYSRNYSRSI